jgi:hypothetical protein
VAAEESALAKAKVAWFENTWRAQDCVSVSRLTLRSHKFRNPPSLRLGLAGNGRSLF